jgi:hypothetical protein
MTPGRRPILTSIWGARIAWSVLARGRDFEASTIAAVNAQSAYLPASDGERETR